MRRAGEPDADAVGDQFDRPVKIGPIRREAGSRAKCPERLGGGVAVLVLLSRRDQGDARVRGGNELGRAARVGPVVTDLQHLHLRNEAAFEEQALHRGLRVAGQEDVRRSIADDCHDRRVVDVALGERCLPIRIGWKEDVEDN